MPGVLGASEVIAVRVQFPVEECELNKPSAAHWPLLA